MREIIEVPFYADKIQATREGGQAWVVVKRVCENLGIDHAGQFTKIKGLAWAVVAMIATTGPDGKSYEMLCLDLESLPMWLATIDANRVAPEARFQLVTYQREAKAALAKHFFGTGSAEFDEIREELRQLRGNVAALWSHTSSGGYIAPARFEALQREWRELADIEVLAGLWPDKPAKPGKRKANPRAAAIKDILRDMGEHTEWGGKSQPWAQLPAALEPAARAVINRRKRDALRRKPPELRQQLELVVTTGPGWKRTQKVETPAAGECL